MDAFSDDISLFKYLLALCVIVTGFAAPQIQKLTLYVLHANGNGATLEWGGLDLKVVNGCEYSYRDMTNQSQGIPVEMLKRPVDNKLHLNDLLPSTLYNVHLSCEINDMWFESDVNMTTAPDGETITFSPPEKPSMKAPSSKPNVMPLVPSSVPTVTKEKINSHTDPVDIALGVVFGLVAVGIVCTVGYYFLKKFRRRQRIRRFLQYRQQENDPFPDIDPDDGDSEERVTF